MADSFPTCLAFTLHEEGGYSDNPHDAGGATMCGVTLSTYRVFCHNPNATPNDLKSISHDDLKALYFSEFWTPIQGSSLPLGVDLMIFDQAVNAGVSRSVKILQGYMGLTPDGVLGTTTLATVQVLDPADLVNGLAMAQTTFYQSLDDYNIFGKDWLRRVNDRRTAAFNMTSIA